MTQIAMTRDLLIRNRAAVVAARRQATIDAAAAVAADHQASLAAGAAEVAALVNMGAFYCGRDYSAAPKVRAVRGEKTGEKMTRYYNGLVETALARGMTKMMVNGRCYQINPRKADFNPNRQTGRNMVAALEAALAH